MYVKIKLSDNLYGFVTDILMPRVRFLEQVILWQDAVISLQTSQGHLNFLVTES